MDTRTRRLGIDFGTSNTVAILERDDGSATPLLFDASPLLSSAVFAGTDGALLTGADAERAAAGNPAGFDANPKRRIDDGTVWLGERALAVPDLIGAVLARTVAEAQRVSGRSPVGEVVLTHPAAWGRTRLGLLERAARHAGLTGVRLVPEPVAAAAYFATELGRDLSPGRCVVVYDLGAGTFDISVVRRTAGGFEVLATDGLPDLGGLDLDATLVAHARSLTADATAAWGRLDWPETTGDQRARRTLWQGARAAKEQLSRHSTAPLHVPLVERELHVTREEFERAARAHLDRTVALTVATLRAAAVPREQIEGLFLVGGASRIPLVATLLQRGLGISPTVIDQPELVVARGSLSAVPAAAGASAGAGPVPAAPPPGPPAGFAGSPPATASPMGAMAEAFAGERGVRSPRRRAVLIGAAGLVAVLVLAGGGVALWASGVLPGSTPSSAAGVPFTAAGKKNAKLFDSDDLLALAAPFLNDANCARREAAKTLEEVDCDARAGIWHVAFSLPQGDDERQFQRPTASGGLGRAGFEQVTFTAVTPKTGWAAWWSDKEPQECHVYWEDGGSGAVADLHEVGPDPSSTADPALLCRITWQGRLHPKTTKQPGS